MIDHVWIRVADVAAAKGFYATIAPHAGFRLETDHPERVQFARDTGSFSLVGGTPSEHVHMAFAVPDDASVDAFHEAARAAGHASHEAPAERRTEDARAYAASAVDPDGNHVELVHHSR